MVTVYDKETGAALEVHAVDGHELVRKGLFTWALSQEEAALAEPVEAEVSTEPSKKRGRKAKS